MKYWTLLIALFCTSLVYADEMVDTGAQAPDFNLQDQYGDWHSKSDFEGKWLVLYFYPKDDTPGCTTEACNFRDNIYAFKGIGAEIVGISVDDVASHKDFSDKYRLPFVILADSEGEMSEQYGVLRDLKVMKMAKRQSFIINPDGMVAKTYRDVDPDTHSEEVLADLKQLMGEDEQA